MGTEGSVSEARGHTKAPNEPILSRLDREEHENKFMVYSLVGPMKLGGFNTEYEAPRITEQNANSLGEPEKGIDGPHDTSGDQHRLHTTSDNYLMLGT